MSRRNRINIRRRADDEKRTAARAALAEAALNTAANAEADQAEAERAQLAARIAKATGQNQ